MRVKLNNNGYTKIYDSGAKTAVTGDYSNDDEVVEFLANGGVIEPFETVEEIVAREKVEANQVILQELEELDRLSIRDIREWIASQASAPQLLKDREAQAILKRGQLQP